MKVSRVAPLHLTASSQAAALDGGHQGNNRPVKATSDDGDRYIFKHNATQCLGKIADLVPERQTRFTDIKEVVGSHIFADEIGLHAVTYQEAWYIDSSGKRQNGIASKMQDGLQTMETFDVHAIQNPDEAVVQTITKGWMGDFDITLNKSNTWVTSNNTTVAGDFGNSLRRGITVLRVPRANQEIMQTYADPGNVEPTVNYIRGLTDDQIRGMVDRTGQKWIHDWTPEISGELSDTLIHNRDLLRQNNPFAHYYEGFHPALHAPVCNYVAPLVHYSPLMQKFFSEAGKAIINSVRRHKDTPDPRQMDFDFGAPRP